MSDFFERYPPRISPGTATSVTIYFCVFRQAHQNNLERLWLTRTFTFIFLLNSPSFIRSVFRGYILLLYCELSWHFNNDIIRLYYSHVNRLWLPITLKFVTFLILSCSFDFYVFNFIVYFSSFLTYLYENKRKGNMWCPLQDIYCIILKQKNKSFKD